jgi:transcriptional regulator GlxA family with amidase domain
MSAPNISTSQGWTKSNGIDQIATHCGYASAEVLRRTFLRQAGVTPKQYRDRFNLLAAS